MSGGYISLLLLAAGALPLTTTFSSLQAKLFPKDRNVRALIAYNALQGFYLGYILVFWQPFILGLGVSIAAIGILEAFSGQSGLLSSFVQSVGGRLSDSGRKRVILLGSSFLTLCWLTSTIAFIVKVPVLIYAAYILWALGALSIPALDAILADTVEAGDRSRIYSIIVIANLLPSSLTGFLAGQYSQSLGAETFLGLAALFECSGLVVLWRALKDSRTNARVVHSRPKVRIEQTLSNIRSHWKYFSVMSMDSLTWAIGTSLLFGLLSKVQGFSKGDFGLIALTLPIGVVVGTIPGGWLAHKIGSRTLLLISEFLGVAMLLGWALYPSALLAPLYAFMWGFAISTWLPVQFHLSSHLFPQKNRGELMGNLGTVRGFIRSLGPIIAVSLYLVFGYSAPMIGGAIGILLTNVLIAKFIPSKIAPLDEEGEKSSTG